MGWLSVQNVLLVLFGIVCLEGSFNTMSKDLHEIRHSNRTNGFFTALQLFDDKVWLSHHVSTGAANKTFDGNDATIDLLSTVSAGTTGTDNYDSPICYDTIGSKDCNVGYVCIKEDGFDYGICVKQWTTDGECWKCSGLNQICPKDSRLSEPPYPYCCNSTTVQCLCNECPPVRCGPNQSVMILSVGNGKPGSCCDTYKCLEGSNVCTYGKVLYKDNETWSPDKCSVCRCEKGFVYCDSQTCEPSAGCGFMFTPKNECCPVCAGCMSDSRLFMLNQSWLEDEGCFKCSCNEGRARCTAEYCLAPPCDNPRKLENVCCPVCDDPSTSVDLHIPSKCSAIEESLAANCNLVCEFGFSRGPDGCLECSCAKPPCEPKLCPFGFAAEEKIRRSCDCKPSRCGQITCAKLCAYGFEGDPTSKCPTCKCRPCPKLQNCTIDCVYGYKIGTNGCPMCDCLTAGDKPEHPIFQSCSIEGHQYEHMEIFFDGCRKCICLNGTQLCSLISCPPVNCPSMSIKPGSCCPSCTETDVQKSRFLKAAEGLDSLCVGVGSTPLPDGESLIIDECTACKCFVGKAFCSVADCRDSLKNCTAVSTAVSPFRVHGSCCPTCDPGPVDGRRTLVSSSRSNSLVPCHEGSSIYNDGDYWMPNECQSCLCRGGVTYCYPHQCPLLTCGVAVLKKGACCPFCLERALMTVCIFDGKVHRNGDSWKVNDCTSCVCRKGQIVCTSTVCSPIHCNFPVSVSGHCCPICLDNIPIFSNASDSQQIKLGSNQAGGMLYASLMGAIILLIVVVVLLIVIIWRANLCCTGAGHYANNRHHPVDRVRVKQRLFRQKSRKGQSRAFQQDSSVLNSLCTSIQFDTTDNSGPGVFICGNGLKGLDGSTKAYYSTCSYGSGGRLLENHGRLVKYELIGGGAGKHGGATVGISEHNPVDYRTTMASANDNSSSLLLLSSNRSECCELCSCCGCCSAQVPHQKMEDIPTCHCNGSGTLSDLFWDQNNNAIATSTNNSLLNPDNLYNEVEESGSQKAGTASHETSVVYV